MYLHEKSLYHVMLSLTDLFIHIQSLSLLSLLQNLLLLSSHQISIYHPLALLFLKVQVFSLLHQTLCIWSQHLVLTPIFILFQVLLLGMLLYLNMKIVQHLFPYLPHLARNIRIYTPWLQKAKTTSTISIWLPYSISHSKSIYGHSLTTRKRTNLLFNCS